MMKVGQTLHVNQTYEVADYKTMPDGTVRPYHYRQVIAGRILPDGTREYFQAPEQDGPMPDIITM